MNVKQVKWAFGFLTLFLCNVIGATESKITHFNLSNINNQNISENLKYYSLRNNATNPPKYLRQLNDWLNTLSPQQTTHVLGDKYLVSFELFNDTQTSEWFIYPYGSVVQSIEMFYFSDSKPAEINNTGQRFRNQQNLHYGSSISVAPGQKKTVVMVFNSEYFFAPIKVLVKPQNQAEQLFQFENTLLLISLGICFALGVYNLFLYFSTRYKQYLYYAMAILSYALGWASVFGVPENAGFGRSEHWLMPAFLLGTFFSCFFNIQFLNLQKSAPRSAKSLKIIAWIAFAALPFAFFSQGLGLYLASIMTSAMLLMGLYTGVKSWKLGYSPAKYFVFGLLSVLLPNMIGNLMNLGILPGLNLNIYLLGLLGNSLDSLLLAFALAAQVKLLTDKNIKLAATLENTVAERTQELRNANIQLEQTNIDLVEASNAKGRFLASMSHEIRTPLTSIIGYADGILLGDIDKAEQERVTKIIAENGNHLLSVVNNILDISKIEANKLEFESIPTSLFSVLAQIESVVSKRARDKGLAFHLEYEYPLPAQINSDPTRLRQILFNLTNNALKFTEQGYVGLSVSLIDKQLQIKVKDSGEGITEQHQALLFQPFAQADSSINRRFGGTGLGLSISQKLAQGLGGDISVQSTPRKGATFMLTLDVSVAKDSAWVKNVNEIWQSTPSQSLKPATLPNFSEHKVLLADDHPTNRELIAILLKRMNITVTEVENGKQVLETIFYQKFDLILMDIHMPQMDGSEAIKQLRAAGNTTPVIALTANSMKHEIEHYMRLGFSDHLAKPLSRHQFVNTLSLYLNKQGEIDHPIHQGDMLQLIKDYQQDLKEQLKHLQQALAQRDLTTISEISHKIRGSAGAFGFDIIANKFADIEHCALQDDEISVTYELPKVIALAQLFVTLPGVDIPHGIVRYHNSGEQFLRALFELLEHAPKTLTDLTSTFESKDLPSALEQISKLVVIWNKCALLQSIEAIKSLQDIVKQEDPDPQQYKTHLQIIESHLAELRQALQSHSIEQL